MKLGFIGLGIMGTPMAINLARAGHQLHVTTIGPVADELLSLGAVSVETAHQVTEASDIIFIMVPDTPQVEEVLFGENGCTKASLKGKTIVDMSSISPIETKRFARQVNELGGDYLDAPVSGGEIGAREGTLSIMVGGDEAVSEALLFASKAGADPVRVRQALMGGFASSRILEVHGERMIKRTFNPGFKIALHQKDLNLALQSAKALALNLPNTATCQELFNTCAANGGSQLDHSALVQALELMANHKLA
ncbi:TPA: NAD(P)-binding domain-containing protein [Escherichia coli]|uniref:NAD(P)-binding domain-containing protein n=1 Tax=Escherichia coli TaxID=562 RepID=UPI003B81BCBC